MKIEYVVDVGYGNIDDEEVNSLLKLPLMRFVIVDLEEEDGDKIFIKGFWKPQEGSLERTIDEMEEDSAEAIAEYLVKIDAFGREFDLYKGTIRCAIDGDEDGLYDLIEDKGITVNIEEDVPDLIEDYDGRLFAICWKYEDELVDNIDQINELYIEELIADSKHFECWTVVSD